MLLDKPIEPLSIYPDRLFFFGRQGKVRQIIFALHYVPEAIAFIINVFIRCVILNYDLPTIQLLWPAIKPKEADSLCILSLNPFVSAEENLRVYFPVPGHEHISSCIKTSLARVSAQRHIILNCIRLLNV